MDGHRDGWRDRQIYRQMGIWIDEWRMEGQMDGLINGWTDRQIFRWIDRWMDGRSNGRREVQTDGKKMLSIKKVFFFPD